MADENISVRRIQRPRASDPLRQEKPVQRTDGLCRFRLHSCVRSTRVRHTGNSQSATGQEQPTDPAKNSRRTEVFAEVHEHVSLLGVGAAPPVVQSSGAIVS